MKLLRVLRWRLFGYPELYRHEHPRVPSWNIPARVIRDTARIDPGNYNLGLMRRMTPAEIEEHYR